MLRLASVCAHNGGGGGGADVNYEQLNIFMRLSHVLTSGSKVEIFFLLFGNRGRRRNVCVIVLLLEHMVDEMLKYWAPYQCDSAVVLGSGSHGGRSPLMGTWRGGTAAAWSSSSSQRKWWAAGHVTAQSYKRQPSGGVLGFPPNSLAQAWTSVHHVLLKEWK